MNDAGGTRRLVYAPAALATALLLILPLLPLCPAAAAASATEDTAWIVTYPSCGSCEARTVAPAEGGGYVIAGTVLNSPSDHAMIALRTDTSGNELWRVAGGGSCEGDAVVPVDSGQSAVAGGGCSGAAALTVLDNGKGTVMSHREYDAGRSAVATSLISTGDGGFLLLSEAGSGEISRSDRDLLIHRVGPDGSLSWSRAFSQPLNDTGAAALQTVDGGFVIAATTETGSDGGTDIVVISLDPSGEERWMTDVGRNDDECAAGIVPAEGGGYIVAGTACGRKEGFDCDFFAAGITADGKVLWDRRYGGTGREFAATIVREPGGLCTIAGSTDSPDLNAIGRDIRIVQIAGNGDETGNITFGTAAYETVGGATLSPDGSLILAGFMTDPVAAKSTLFLINAGKGGMTPPGSLLETAPVGNTGATTVSVRDAATGNGIADALVYIDGRLACRTSPDSGSCTVAKQKAGPHSCRVTGDGYRGTTVRFSGSDASLIVSLQPSAIHKLTGANPPEHALDIVFVPSDTSYDCTKGQAVPDERYTKNSAAFLADIRRLVANRLLTLDTYSSAPAQFPLGYRGQMNIWYYWDGYSFVNAFDSCAGTLPGGFYDEAPFTDVAVILYPEYKGTDTTGTCEPVGCTSGPGPGPGVHFKVAADRGTVFLHECGHAMFGLMDTYCGDTYYEENQPDANVWRSDTGCRDDARKNGWNATLCRPITGSSSEGAGECSTGFFRYDPDPDLMSTTALSARFGDAATRRIAYVLGAVKGG